MSLTALDLAKILFSTMLYVLLSTSIVLNLLVVISSGLLLKKDVKPRTTYMLLGNLALCDLVVGVTGLLEYSFKMFEDAEQNHLGCNIAIGFYIGSNMRSILSIMLIAIDRYIYIIHGMHYYLWMTSKLVKTSIIAVWIIGCILGNIHIFVNYKSIAHEPCTIADYPPSQLGLIITLCLAPLIVLSALYLIILYETLRQTRRIHHIDRRANDASKRKALKLMIYTTLCALITIVPGPASWTVFLIANASLHSTFAIWLRAAHWLIVAATLLNPVIYAWWYRDFLPMTLGWLERVTCKRDL